ncbi:MAG: hypothetical protein M3441_13505 [Chloroflexota bacterium]|nr:hypothetical protein [Chloroflexota bacterium]
MVRHLRNLEIHSARLASLIAELSVQTPSTSAITRSGEKLDWNDASTLLKLASSIIHMDIDTTRFDDPMMSIMCSNAARYHEAESDLLSKLVLELTKFNFTWGALECVTKIIDPPKVPKRASIVDAACNYLKHHYEPRRSLDSYDDAVANLRIVLHQLPYYGITDDDFSLRQPGNFLGISGMGLHIIRKIRNKLAHGTLNFPTPVDRSDKTPVDVELISISTRIALLSIQMLMIAFFKEEHLTIWWRESFQASDDPGDDEEAYLDSDIDDDDDEQAIDLILLLTDIHLRADAVGTQISKYQMSLPF